MSWFRRNKENILTESTERNETPEGVWTKCERCDEIIHRKQLEQNYFTCQKCEYHFRITSSEYISFFLDEHSFKEMDRKIRSADPLKFEDTKPYRTRLQATMKATNLYDAIKTGTGTIEKIPLVVGCMDFSFIGGSMGSVVGEKVARAVDQSKRKKLPLVLISSSGGARMMEAALSLMQLAKTCGKLSQLHELHIPFISILTDPTTGGVTASFSMMGDINIGEPGALIGFAGPRVIKQTIGKDLPEGFQRSEFLLEHGFLDLVVHRRDMKKTVATLLRMIM
ncbi:MAG: acetyl-CoA carboxylase carboxyltransferase subunit beta [Ignavibacteria bacterium]|nr:acetyl-CoA carboxylase carboxyltransferase subunit beta [Ignavibacteria bacterium]